VRDRSSVIPKYDQVDQAVRQRLGTLRPGSRLPAEPALCRERRVSQLVARGDIARYVMECPADTPRPAATDDLARW
jgi:hypothetical protein